MVHPITFQVFWSDPQVSKCFPWALWLFGTANHTNQLVPQCPHWCHRLWWWGFLRHKSSTASTAMPNRRRAASGPLLVNMGGQIKLGKICCVFMKRNHRASLHAHQWGHIRHKGQISRTVCSSSRFVKSGAVETSKHLDHNKQSFYSYRCFSFFFAVWCSLCFPPLITGVVRVSCLYLPFLTSSFFIVELVKDVKLWCRRAKTKQKKWWVLISLEFFARKKIQITHVVTSWRFYHSQCSSHLVWNIVLIRIWTLIRLCSACKPACWSFLFDEQ